MSFYRPNLDVCPKCGNNNLYYEVEQEIKDGAIKLRATCLDCEERWVDRYTYSYNQHSYRADLRRCPHCDGDHLDLDFGEVDDCGIDVRTTCKDCEEWWADNFDYRDSYHA